MHVTLVFHLAGILLAGCAEPGYRNTTYRVGDSPEHAAEQAKRVLEERMQTDSVMPDDRLDGPPQLVHSVLPPMPPRAVAKGVEGDVVAVVTIDETGAVSGVSIQESPDATLSDAVADAVKQWRFQPMTANGQPTKFRVRQTFKFRIKSSNRQPQVCDQSECPEPL